jgi:diguanylate cyclase (GGDEF)-like protein
MKSHLSPKSLLGIDRDQVRLQILQIFKTLAIVIGGMVLLYAIFAIDRSKIDFGLLFLAIVNIVVVSRMTLHVPASDIFITFSDGVLFFTLLLYGPEAAIILASLETFGSCIRMKNEGIAIGNRMICLNTGLTAISSGFTVIALWGLQSYFKVYPQSSNMSELVVTLCVLAFVQFVSVSFLAAVFQSLKNNVSILVVIRKGILTTSITQIVGAGVAGVFYKLISQGDVFASTSTLVIFIVAYFSYRQSISQMNSSFSKAESLEKEKTESERLRAEQAEKHIDELNIAIVNQADATKALNRIKEEFRHAALHDALTGLANRTYLFERLNFYIIKNQADIPHNFCTLFLDLHRFGEINESLGHTVGDKLLKTVAQRLERIVGDEDIVARIGGDEFAIVLNNTTSVDDAVVFATNLRQKLLEPFVIAEHRIFLNPQIGIAAYDKEYQIPEDIIRDADIAMNHAKNRNLPFSVYDKDLREKLLKRTQLASDLRFALERKEFEMFYQPLFSLKSEKIIGFEALIRWYHPKRGLVQPNDFIPILEESGLIIPITVWILDETCGQLAKWQKISSAYKNLIMSVNISGKHLSDKRLVKDVELAISNSEIDASCLKLELTESIAMENVEMSVNILNELKKLGVQLSIDDFGTGYSSLSHLHKLPFDTLKVDRSFVNNASNIGGWEILNTIISLARNLKMRVIAEGIETKEQMDILKDLECEYAQGYFFSKPIPREEMEQKLTEKFRWFPRKERKPKLVLPQIITVSSPAEIQMRVS